MYYVIFRRHFDVLISATLQYNITPTNLLYYIFYFSNLEQQ